MCIYIVIHTKDYDYMLSLWNACIGLGIVEDLEINQAPVLLSILDDMTHAQVTIPGEMQ